MSATVDERITDEVAALEAILMSDIIINTVDDVPHSIEVVVHPSTGNDREKQYVCVTLEVKLTKGYPDISPEVTLRNPRGLDDKLLDCLYEKINKKLNDCRGQPVVFDLLQVIRDDLSKKNLPRGQCAICLYGFFDGDEFVKTTCYHFYHSHCLGKHFILGRKYFHEEMDKLPNWQQMEALPYQETCPVCRANIYFDVETLKKAPPPMQSVNSPPFTLTPEIKAMQRKMADLLAYQTSKGGVIGVGDNEPKPLTITSPSDQEENDKPSTSNASPQASPAQAGTSARQDKVSAAQANTVTNSNDNSGGRVPYRGFNRRAKPGRRGRGPR